MELTLVWFWLFKLAIVSTLSYAAFWFAKNKHLKAAISVTVFMIILVFFAPIKLESGDGKMTSTADAIIEVSRESVPPRTTPDFTKDSAWEEQEAHAKQAREATHRSLDIDK